MMLTLEVVDYRITPDQPLIAGLSVVHAEPSDGENRGTRDLISPGPSHRARRG